MHKAFLKVAHKAMIGIAAGALLSVPTMAGEIYRTVDAQGNVVYQDTPPKNGEGERLARRTQTTDSNYVARVQEQLAASRKVTEEQRKDTNLTRAQAADRAEQRATNCEKAQARLEKAQTSRRIYEDKGDGERRYFSSEEQDAYRTKAQADVDEWCS